jgi:hypothetical protein
MFSNNLDQPIIVIKKFLRFVSIYGFRRTFVKVFGRLRIKSIFSLRLDLRRYPKNVGIIGCGQFAFSTIAYFLDKNRGKVLLTVFDINQENVISLANYFGVNYIARNVEEMLADEKLNLLFIASNHYTHTDYAIKALEKKGYIRRTFKVPRSIVILKKA